MSRAYVDLQFRARDASFKRDMRRINQRMNRSFASMRKSSSLFSSQMKAALSFTAIGFGVRSTLRPWADYEEAMANVAAKTGAARREMGQLDDVIRAAAKISKFTPAETAEAAGYLAQAGLGLKNIASAIQPTLDLATATRTSIDQTADILTNIATPLKLLDDAGIQRTADVLSKVAASANVNLQELGLSASYAAPEFTTLGISLEEGIGLMGALGDSAIKGSRAGVVFRQISGALISGMTEVNEATGEGAKALTKQAAALQKYNIKIKGTDGQLRPFVEILEEFHLKMRDLNKDARAGALLDIFGERARTSMQIWLADLEKSKRVIAGAHDAAGNARAQAATQMDNLKGDMTTLGSIIADVSIDIANAGLGEMTRQWAQNLAAFFEQNRRTFIAAGQAISISIKAIISALGQMKDLVMGPLFPLVLAGLAGWGSAKVIGGLAALTGTLIKLKRALTGIVLLSTGFVGLFVFVGAGAAAVVLAFSNEIRAFFKTISNWLKSMGVDIPAIASAIADAVSGFFNAVQSMLSWIIEKIRVVISSIQSAIAWFDALHKKNKPAEIGGYSMTEPAPGDAPALIPGPAPGREVAQRLNQSDQSADPESPETPGSEKGFSFETSYRESLKSGDQVSMLEKTTASVKNLITELMTAMGISGELESKILGAESAESLASPRVGGPGAGVAIDGSPGMLGGGGLAESAAGVATLTSGLTNAMSVAGQLENQILGGGGGEGDGMSEHGGPGPVGAGLSVAADGGAEGAMGDETGGLVGGAIAGFGMMTEAAHTAASGINIAFKSSLTDLTNLWAQKSVQMKNKMMAAMVSIYQSGMAIGGKFGKWMKKLAIADAIISGAMAIQRALSAPPGFPWNAVAVAAVAVKTLVQIKTIKGTAIGSAHAGMTDVPESGSYILKKGERVLSSKLNADLKKFMKIQSPRAPGAEPARLLKQSMQAAAFAGLATLAMPAAAGIADIPAVGPSLIEPARTGIAAAESSKLKADSKPVLNVKSEPAVNVYLQPSEMYSGADLGAAFGGESGTVILQSEVR